MSGFQKCFIVQLPIYLRSKMCYEFEIPENVKLTRKKAPEKEDTDTKLELEPIKVSN
jgi:hypothetical protein